MIKTSNELLERVTLVVITTVAQKGLSNVELGTETVTALLDGPKGGDSGYKRGRDLRAFRELFYVIGG
jgi:hypothetical protein